MKKVLFIILLITHYSLLITVLHAQNLVPNASFENFSSCPSDQGQIIRAVPWYSPTYYLTESMSDLLNECSPPFPISIVNIPFNIWGYQYPRTGKGFAGEEVFSNNDESREYISVKLDSALEAGKTYCIEYYISLSNYGDTIQQPNIGSTFGIDRMGAYLSNTVINLNTHYAIPVIPQIENPKGHFLSDTLNWMLVSGSFIASGGEQYITIGNFYVNDSTNYIQISNSKSHLTYYYIDDVSVYPCNAPVYAANAGTNVTICKGDSVQIGTAPHAQYLYSWLPIAGLSDTSIANPKASPAVTTTYYLHQKDFKFDETTDSVTVTVNPVPAVTASASPANICSDSSSTLTATGTATAYSWSNGSTGNQITVSPVTTTAYTVTGTGNYGCTNTFSLTITVKSCEDTTKNTLIIPNAFTPNGDGYNDYFKINGQNIRSINGKIFNRWGEELFKYTDVNSKWDGKYKGKDVSDGVYFYIVEVTFNNGEAREKHGSIEVVK